MILAGRRLNDDMGRYIASETVKLMLKKRIHVADAHILILGLTFKENCPDLRNTRVIDIIEELNTFGAVVEVYDPWINAEEARRLYGVNVITELPSHRFDAVILAVAHKEFTTLSADDLQAMCKPASIIYDVKNVLPAALVDGCL